MRAYDNDGRLFAEITQFTTQDGRSISTDTRYSTDNGQVISQTVSVTDPSGKMVTTSTIDGEQAAVNTLPLAEVDALSRMRDRRPTRSWLRPIPIEEPL